MLYRNLLIGIPRSLIFFLLQAKQHSLKTGDPTLRDGGGGDGVADVESGGERGVHVYAERGAEVTVHHGEEGERRKLTTTAAGRSKVGG